MDQLISFEERCKTMVNNMFCKPVLTSKSEKPHVLQLLIVLQLFDNLLQIFISCLQSHLVELIMRCQLQV